MKIPIRLLNEGTDVWRYVDAVQQEDGNYVIAEQEIPDDEEWEFKPGQRVEVLEERDSSWLDKFTWKEQQEQFLREITQRDEVLNRSYEKQAEEILNTMDWKEINKKSLFDQLVYGMSAVHVSKDGVTYVPYDEIPFDKLEESEEININADDVIKKYKEIVLREIMRDEEESNNV